MKNAKPTFDDNQKVIERSVFVGGTHIRVKSVFGVIPLEKAMASIVKRKLEESRDNDKS